MHLSGEKVMQPDPWYFDSRISERFVMYSAAMALFFTSRREALFYLKYIVAVPDGPALQIETSKF